MTDCKECFWHGKPIDCPASFNIDTHECKNFRAKETASVKMLTFPSREEWLQAIGDGQFVKIMALEEPQERGGSIMTDNEKCLIHIPKDANYIEILGHRIDGYDSFEAFCEHLKKYAELEETINRQKAEIDEQDQAIINALKRMGQIRAEAITEFAERLTIHFGTYTDKDYLRVLDMFRLIDQIAKEMKGEQ